MFYESQDLPWLPVWLQRHQVEVSEESQATTSQSLKVLHLHLHLSSYGDSQHSQSVPFHEPQIQRDCNKLLSVQQVETSAGAGWKTDDNVVLPGQQDETSASNVNKTIINKVLPLQQAESSAGTEDKSYQLKTDNNAGDGNSLPPTSIQKVSESLGIQSPVLKLDSERQSERNSNVRYLQVADVSDAVELSISASEALVIHELVKSESASEALPAAAVIEAALQVKQARLEGLEDAFHYPSEAFKEIDEIDILSDLDDWDIADACEDVGLSFIDPDNKLSGGSDASQVKFIPSAENHYGCDNEFKHIDVQAQQEKHHVDPALALNSSLLASHNEPVLHQSTHEISHVLSVAQPEAGMDSFLSRDSDNAARKDITSYSVEDQFSSCWFGGWTGVEVEVPPELEQNNSKSIPKFYVNETSFFSESAPDENSFVQKRETGSKITSQSSVRFEGSYKKADEGILISQDVSSSILSSVDPLCSVVPCSISSMNTNSPLAEEHNDIEVNAEKQPLEVENWWRTTDLNVESFHGDRNHAPTFDRKSSETPVRRQLTLLKNYSTLLPKHDSNLERGRLYHNQSFLSEYDAELLPLELNMSRSLPFRSASNCAVGTGNEEACNTSLIRREAEETENHNKSHGAELQFQTLKEGRSPRILNRRTRCRLHSSKLLVDNIIGKKGPKEAAEQETVTKLHQRNNSKNVLSECYNVLDTQAPARKQVHFMEVEVELQQNEDIQKPRSSHEIHSSKKSKYSNAWLHSRTQDIKRRLTTRAKNGKKLIFQGIEFLLTGFSSQKEKEIEGLIRKYGGMVLSGIPPPNSRRKRSAKSNFQQLPVILCPKKLKTTQFLYGCAVNAFILKVKWLSDSIAAGSVIPPEKYTILSNQADAEITGIGKLVFHDNNGCIFERVGIMLLGSHSFCTKFTLIFMHGGGIVFKTLHWLVQSLETEKISVPAIVAEDERRVSRHLRHCASERKIPMMTASWIIKCLHLGKLLPFKENKRIPLPSVKVPEIPFEWSEQI
ncbi:hypothetical protein LWI29_026052 [Acer saccharum]|uniref:BRCT domain-containing protein n=1 Tax=Acer saccharum TaxID=4024 RepID=A0AA39SL05_ACESA|nr:hypothetical protein LWI29_026052 [Acer saccharum]